MKKIKLLMSLSSICAFAAIAASSTVNTSITTSSETEDIDLTISSSTDFDGKYTINDLKLPKKMHVDVPYTRELCVKLDETVVQAEQ